MQIKKPILAVHHGIENNFQPILIGALGSALFFMFQKSTILLVVIFGISLFTAIVDLYVKHSKKKHPNQCPYCNRFIGKK